jgi:hypothetical protein
VRIFEALQARLRDAQFVDASFLINELRIVKSPAEVEYLRQAARAAQAVSAGPGTVDAAPAGAASRCNRYQRRPPSW